ncbi:hypothetical protein BS78_07G064000 [Paspalum vaginatum]|nr:hypothetical protein BS78_07G064000 [Paspalum vaginatum]
MRTSCLLFIVLALVAQYSVCRDLPLGIGMATKAVTPQDCRSLSIGHGRPCVPASCFKDCQSNIGPGTIGECADGGCQCTYCTPPK